MRRHRGQPHTAPMTIPPYSHASPCGGSTDDQKAKAAGATRSTARAAGAKVDPLTTIRSSRSCYNGGSRNEGQEHNSQSYAQGVARPGPATRPPGEKDLWA